MCTVRHSWPPGIAAGAHDLLRNACSTWSMGAPRLRLLRCAVAQVPDEGTCGFTQRHISEIQPPEERRVKRLVLGNAVAATSLGCCGASFSVGRVAHVNTKTADQGLRGLPKTRVTETKRFWKSLVLKRRTVWPCDMAVPSRRVVIGSHLCFLCHIS